MLELLTLGRDQAIRIALVLALLAGVTAAAFGIGYRSSDAVLGDGSAYVQKGHTVVHVNGESGQADAKAARDLATGTQRLEVVQVRPGEVYVVNNATDEVWRLPTDTMLPERVATGAPASPPAAPQESENTQPDQAPKVKAQLVTGGGAAYLHHPEAGTLNLLKGQQTFAVPIPVKVSAAVVDDKGVAWALSKQDGYLYEIHGAEIKGRQTVAIPNEPARLTLAQGKPVVLLPERGGDGLVRVIGGAEPAEMVVPAQPDGAIQVARPGSGEAVLVTIDQRDDTVVTIDLKNGEEQRAQLEGRSGPRLYGRPVVSQEHIYIPDFTRRQVVVLKLKPLRQVRSVSVPGKEAFFEVFEREGRVWVNDPYSRTLLSFKGDKWIEADKGEGNGIPDDKPSPSVPPSPTASPTRTAGPKPPSPKSSPKPSLPPPPPPRRIAVPAVAGLTGPQACAQVTAAELTCLPPVTRQQTGCETDKALDSTPATGSLVAPGTQVTVFVCGPAAMPGPLVGMPLDQACRTVEAAGLVCTHADGGPAPTPAQVGTVSAQAPPPGTPVPNGAHVQVAYFTSVGVPNITGMGPDQACATLQGHGLQCAPNPEEITWQANVVHGQSHPPGTPVPLGTPIGYLYQDNAPSLLNRYKLSGHPVRVLSVGGPPGGSWAPQPAMGGVYRWGEAVPGLVWVNQFRCASNCAGGARPTGYYYANQHQGAPGGSGNWVNEGPAFTCFGAPQPGTAPLQAMYKPGDIAWAFAPAGSWEHQIHAADGYGDRFTICHIWHGVPGLP
jgi:hypothetical protein